MARYWVGDLHLGHGKVAQLRGFNTIHEHDDTILHQLSQLSAEDQVWILGDISSGKPEDETDALKLLSEIEAQLHLIAGNHDSVSGIHRNGYKQQRRWLEVFESVQDYTRVRLYRRNVLMSHYPFARSGDGPERPGARYMEWRLPDTGMGLIHAHTHATTVHMPNAHRVGFLPPEEQLDTQQMCVSWR